MQPGIVNISTDDTFRITRMVYRNEYLIMFMTGHIAAQPNKVFQFYIEGRCNLSSYALCRNNHATDKCQANCKSYKTMVIPGLKNVYTHKENVVKYTRTRYNLHRRALDYFLNDINRVHMQLNIFEGQYVRFAQPQRCFNHRLQCDIKNDKLFETLFNFVTVEELTKEIVPVIACYDIETHSDGVKFSNSCRDHIMSISIVLRRNRNDTKICLYYLKPGARDDLTPGDRFLQQSINAIRFDSEKEMLSAFAELIPLLNADYMLDYNGDKFDLPYLLNRSAVLTTGRPMVDDKKRRSINCQIMRMRRYDLPNVDIELMPIVDKFRNMFSVHLMCYYIHVDLYQFLLTDVEQNELENFQLNTVAKHYLNNQKIDLKIPEMLSLYNRNMVKLIIEYNVWDSVLPIDLFLKLEIIDFVYTQCKLLYLSTDDILQTISNKLNIVFFHKALVNTTKMDDGQVVPDAYIFDKNDLKYTGDNKPDAAPTYMSSMPRRKIPVADIPQTAVKLCKMDGTIKYKGGKVLSPTPGMVEYAASVDFNALYLSIMVAECICLSNLFIAEDDNVYLNKHPDAINPKLLKSLLDQRGVYKKMRDACPPDSFQYTIYDKMQNAVKRIANSIYGYFGIFYKPLASYITKCGRVKLQEAVQRIEAMSDSREILQTFNLTSVKFKVLYGDTDSTFVQVQFKESDVVDLNATRSLDLIKRIFNDYVLKNLNATWNGDYKMALENVMRNLILLKKKKYCYLNSENVIRYKGWLVKKDMPLFMRKIFRNVVDMYLRGHAIECGLETLKTSMFDMHREFYDSTRDLTEYAFSMTYNEGKKSTQKKVTAAATTPVSLKAPAAKKAKKSSAPKKPTITIAQHCRAILVNANVKNLPSVGDRIPFILIDTPGNITQKAFPLSLFDRNSATHRMSWFKHIKILCTFVNELIQIFGDKSAAFEYYLRDICALYMSNQQFDYKYPVLKLKQIGASKTAANKKKKPIPITKFNRKRKIDDDDDDDDDDYDNNDSENNDSENDDEDDDNDNTRMDIKQFSLYIAKPPKLKYTAKIQCGLCAKQC